MPFCDPYTECMDTDVAVLNRGLSESPRPACSPEDEPKTRRQIEMAVDAVCTCGGSGPGEGCLACEVFHKLYPANARPHAEARSADSVQADVRQGGNRHE